MECVTGRKRPRAADDIEHRCVCIRMILTSSYMEMFRRHLAQGKEQAAEDKLRQQNKGWQKLQNADSFAEKVTL